MDTTPQNSKSQTSTETTSKVASAPTEQLVSSGDSSPQQPLSADPTSSNQSSVTNSFADSPLLSAMTKEDITKLSDQELEQLAAQLGSLRNVRTQRKAAPKKSKSSKSQPTFDKAFNDLMS